MRQTPLLKRNSTGPTLLAGKSAGQAAHRSITGASRALEQAIGDFKGALHTTRTPRTHWRPLNPPYARFGLPKPALPPWRKVYDDPPKCNASWSWPRSI